ncbi:MAG: hypothetical protein R3C97_06960 [Geminicoccaceae bacterium]
MRRTRIRTTTTSPGGRVRRSEQVVELPWGPAGIGRGVDNPIQLKDIRAREEEALLVFRDNDVIVEALGGGSITTHGVETDRALLSDGTPVGIGPYVLTMLPGESDVDLVLGLDLETAGTEELLAKLVPAGKSRLGDTLVSKRKLSWLFFTICLLVALVLPIGAYWVAKGHEGDRKSLPRLATLDNVWETGELSDSHKFLADNCEACHPVAFQPTRDEDCTSCHATTGHHFEPARFSIMDAAESGCVGCHAEHQGPTGSVPTQQSLCSDCHATLAATEPATTLIDVSDFGNAHPEFRPSVMTDPATGKVTRATLGAPDFPAEQSDLKFPHNLHIGPETKKTVTDFVTRLDQYEGRNVLECSDCHQPEPGGAYMAKVNMRDHCADCHRLEFDSDAPGRVLPHGLPNEVIAVINDYYIAKALQRIEEVPQAAERQSTRRRAGQTTTAEVRRDTLAEARRQVDQMLAGTFGGRLCGVCHVTSSPEQSASGEWEVAPVFVTEVWEPKARFHHGSHDTMECAECHAAETSKTSADVLLPDIASCRTCHLGEDAGAAIPSSCGMCHIYHDDRLSPLAGETAAHSGTGSGSGG